MKARLLPVAALAAAVCTLSPSPALAATSLFPNLRTLAPTNLSFDTVTYEGRTFKALRFSNTAWNPGSGALELRGKRGGGGDVIQRVFNDAGGWTDHVVAKDLVYHPTHEHFHFPGFAKYELWTKAGWDAHVASGRQSGKPAYGGAKVSFCLMDTRRVQALAGSPGSATYTSCGQTFQGISVGWGDEYGASLDEQWIDLGSSFLRNGSYVLRSIADPDNKLYESAGRGDASKEGVLDNEGLRSFSVKNRKIRLQ